MDTYQHQHAAHQVVSWLILMIEGSLSMLLDIALISAKQFQVGCELL